MSVFIQGEDRDQATLFPQRLDDYVGEENAVRVIDVFIDELDLSGQALTRERCSNSTSTATSIEFSPRVVWNAKPNATSS